MRRLRVAGVLGANLLLAAVATLAGVELLLRLTPGVYVWHDQQRKANEPLVFERDPVLGWRTRPGRYQYPGYSPGASDIRLTIRADGSRATGPDDVARSQRIVLVGDSFTQGWAVSDDETFAWRLQERFPAVQVQNF